MGRIRQPKRRKSMKEVWNIMTQFWNWLTQVWNWNRLLFKDIFRDEIELFFEWKWMKKVWKTLGKPIVTIIAGLVLRTRQWSAPACSVDASVHAQIDTQQLKQSRSQFTAFLLCCQVPQLTLMKTVRVRKTNPVIMTLCTALPVWKFSYVYPNFWNLLQETKNYYYPGQLWTMVMAINWAQLVSHAN